MAFVEMSFLSMAAFSTRRESEMLLLDFSLNLVVLLNYNALQVLLMRLNSSVESLYCTFICLLRPCRLTCGEPRAFGVYFSLAIAKSIRSHD